MTYSSKLRFGIPACALVFGLAFATIADAWEQMYVVHGGANIGAPFGGELGTVDLSTGSYTSLGTPVAGAGLTGIASVGSNFFVSTSNHSLAEVTRLGALISDMPFFGAGFDASVGYRITDLAADSNGNLYAAGLVPGVAWGFYSVNTATGELTELGGLPLNGGGFHSIAFTPDDVLYSHQTNSPGVFDIIDPSTGASMGSIFGGVPGGALGLGYNPADGLLYASECCDGSDAARGERIFSIDPDTGVAIQVLDFNDGRRIQDMVFVIPEPTGVSIIGVVFALAMARRRK